MRMQSYLGSTLFALSAVLAVGTKADPKVDPDVGRTYVGHPNAGCSDYEGFVLREKNVNLVVTSAKCGNGFEAWLSKRVDGANSTSANMIVLDHLVISQLKEGEELSSAPYCYQGKRPLRWLGIYEWRGRKTITHANGGVHAAWTVNASLERFEQAPSKLLDAASCVLEEE